MKAIIDKLIEAVKPIINKLIEAAKASFARLKPLMPRIVELSRKIKSRPPLYILTVFILMVLLIALVRGGGKLYEVIKERQAAKRPAKAELAPPTRIIPVKVFKATRTAFKDSLPVLGTIKGFREVDLKFETAGILESFNFEEGERVEEGDIIASLNQRDALLKLEYSKIELDKSEKLMDAGAIIEIELEKAKLEYESAKSDFEKTNIYAPRDGYLGKKHAEEGEYMSTTSTDKVAAFVDIATVYAEFGIIEKDMPKVQLGQNVEVFVDAYPDVSYKGVVDQASPMVEGKSRTQTVKVMLENENERMKPGMFARAVIATYEKEDALIIPTNAVNKKDPGFFVYVIHRKEPEEGAQEPTEGTPEAEEEAEEEGMGIVEIREVKVKYMAPDYAEISEGLEEEELVAVEVREEFKDKTEVEIKEVQESPF